MTNKIYELVKEIQNQSLDGFLISNFYNLLYLFNFKGLSDREREGWGLVTKNNFYLFTDGRYFNQNNKLNNEKKKLIQISPKENLVYHLNKIIDFERLKRIAFEADDLRVNEFKLFKKRLKADLVATENLILKLREIKNKEELEKINKACQLSTDALKKILKIIKKGVREKEIVFYLENYLKEKGFRLAFDPIVAIDRNSAIPHYVTQEGEGEVKEGSVILIDFGVKFDNYCSDITRMIFYQPKPQTLKIYQLVKNLQEKIIDYINKEKNSSFSLREIDNFGRRLHFLYFSKIGETYPHSTGHGVGLEIHELPKISQSSEDFLKTGQVFTIEPGVYFPNLYGMRIEDTVYVKKDLKVEVLTKFTKEAIVV